jgi:hypothetical protein
MERSDGGQSVCVIKCNVTEFAQETGFLNWITRTLPTLQGRLTTGLALIGAILVGLWPDHARGPDGGKIVAIGLTAIAWLFAELSGGYPPSEHDRVLFQEIQGHFSDGLLNHLGEHDFANDVHKSKFQALWEIGHLHQPLDIQRAI